MRFPWTGRHTERRREARGPATQDSDVTELATRADQILTELDTVVNRMSTMLREAYPDDDA